MDYMKLAYYRTPTGRRIAFYREGRTLIHTIEMDSGGIRIQRHPKSETRYITDIATPSRPAAKSFIAAGRRFGITKAASAALHVVAR